MDNFLTEIESYVARSGGSPQRVLRLSIGAGWGTWEAWRTGASSPTMITADRVRAWMAENPPAENPPAEIPPIAAAGIEAAE